MLTEVILPKQGLQMTEGTLVRWLAAEGDRVEKGRPLFDMETDKLTITIDSPAGGTLLKILHGEGETVPVARVIALIGEAGEDAAWQPGGAPMTTVMEEKPAQPASAPADTAPAPTAPAGRVLVTPRARTVARERGIDPETLVGSGPDGLIIERDVPAAAQPAAAPAYAEPAVEAGAGDTVVPLTGMGGLISENMLPSLQSMAQANHRICVDMGEVKALQEVLKNAGQAVSCQSVIALAAVRALLAFPRMNAWVVGGKIIEKADVNLGVAVAVERGLPVPTVRGAGQLGLIALQAAAAERIAAAKEGRLAPEDLAGGTFTVTNLGMYDIDAFTAVVNPPQVGILAIGRIEDSPVARDGRVVIRPMMVLTLSYDHRAVDGALAAMFLQRIKDLLESPALLLTR